MRTVKTTRIHTHLILLVIALCMLACNKTRIVVEQPNPALKAKFGYKPGTWWIYRDSVSGLSDSFAVVGNRSLSYLIHDFQGHSGIREYATIRQFHNGIVNDTMQWQSVLDNGFTINGFVRDRNNSLVILIPDYQFAYNQPITDLFVNGIMYNNVHQHTDTQFPYAHNDDAGLIKFRFHNTVDTAGPVFVWELVRYNIVK